MGFPGASVVKKLSASARDTGSIPGWERSPGEGNSNPLQYSCLGNPMDGGAWWVTVHGVAKGLDTTYQLNNNKELISTVLARQFYWQQVPSIFLCLIKSCSFFFWYSHCICYNCFSYPLILEYSVLGWVFCFCFFPIFVLLAFQI